MLLVVVIHQLTKVGQFWRCKLVMNVSSNLLQKFQECYLKVYCRIFVDTKLLQRIFSGDKMFSLGIISCLMRLFFKDLMLPKVGIENENSKLESLVPTLLNIVAVTDRAVGTLWIKPQV